MRHHEKHCTKNPDRECGFCRLIGNNPKPIPHLHKIISENVIVHDVDYPHGTIRTYNIDNKLVIDKLKAETDGCPICVFAAIRQYPGDEIFIQYEDYEKDKAEQFRQINEDRWSNVAVSRYS